MKADLLNGICEVRPGESEVLQDSSKTPVGSRIGHEITHSSRQLRLSVDREWSMACNQSSQPAPEYQVRTAAGEGEDQRARLNSDARSGGADPDPS